MGNQLSLSGAIADIACAIREGRSRPQAGTSAEPTPAVVVVTGRKVATTDTQGVIQVWH